MELLNHSDGIRDLVRAKSLLSTISAGQTINVYNADGTLAGKIDAKAPVKDASGVGFAFGTCSTAATATAKTVAIADFILCKMGIVSVLFTNAIDAAGATLNVNSTGAKAIYAMGSPIQPGLVRPQTVVQMQYDGTRYNIVGMFGLEQAGTADDELTVDLGLPSGLLWATRSIDLTQPNGFAASPYQYECSFVSWGNTKMYNPTASNNFSGVYDFGSSNDGPYADTNGAKITYPATLAPSQDCARVILGAPWRMPNTNEFKELIDNCTCIDANGDPVTAETPSVDANARGASDKRVKINNITGLYLQGPNGNRIFFACSGYGYGTSWYVRGANGYFWSSSLHSAANGRLLYFYSGGVSSQDYNSRFGGFAVRPVR